jgi:hypothetical protein
MAKVKIMVFLREVARFLAGKITQPLLRDERAGIFKQYIRARNRVGLGLSYRFARLHLLADLIP